VPELPEVETIRLQLQPQIGGKKIKSIEIFSQKQFIGNPKTVINQKIVEIQRKGKVLSMKLSNNLYLNIHLKLTGELLFTKNKNNPVFPEVIPFTNTKKMPGSTTRIIISFHDGSILFFNDLRKFGWIKVGNKPEQPKGIDVLSNDFSLPLVNSLTRKTDKPIKLLLMDQDKITGIGNIYANDALFLAKIHPQRKSRSLSGKETANLYKAIKKIIEQAILHGGSSGADEAFIKPDGRKGEHQRYFLVYQQENLPCPNCKTPIKRIKQNGRSSFFCPRCQK
jgi:formamidopyrimidine-DNA glycosylase